MPDSSLVYRRHRSDVDLAPGKRHIRRGVVRVPQRATAEDGPVVGSIMVIVDTPKTESTAREVAVPPA